LRVVLAEGVREGVTQRIVEKEVHVLGTVHGHKYILGYVTHTDIALLSLIVLWLLCVHQPCWSHASQQASHGCVGRTGDGQSARPAATGMCVLLCDRLTC
jgi:hypothetical protein